MFKIKVFVTNLAMYNEGDLVGGWLTLPAENDDIHVFMDNVVKISACGDEYFLTDWEDDDVKGLCEGLEVGEYSNVFELSERLEELNNQIGETDAEVLEASLEVFS